MYIIVTRSFPPELGGMQNLMWGLTLSLAKYNLVKVFADYHKEYKEHDEKVSFSIDRVGGAKLFRKYRKAYLVNEFIKKNKNVNCIIADHWKSLELIKTNKKKICLIHSKEINYKKESFRNRRILKAFINVDQIIADLTSKQKELKKFLTRKYGRPGKDKMWHGVKEKDFSYLDQVDIDDDE